jgi:hypothetical protein
MKIKAFRVIDLKKVRLKLAQQAVNPKPTPQRIRNHKVQLERVVEARKDARPLAKLVIKRIREREWPLHIAKQMRQLVLDELIAELSLNWLALNPKKARCADWRSEAKAGRMKASVSTSK